MEVILLDDVDKLGLRGEVVSVARGYARNYLLPRRLAEPATTAKVAELRRRDERRALQEARSADQAQKIAETLTKTVLRFEVKAGPTGSLFGSVTSTQIADEIWRTRKIRVDRRKIDLEPIRRIGRYQVPIDIFEDVRAEVQTLVIPEGGELPSDEELETMAAAERGEPEAPAAEQEAAETEQEPPEQEASAEPVETVEAADEPEAEAPAEAVAESTDDAAEEAGPAVQPEAAAEPSTERHE
jgi:large subunit ribosomal protein L9